MGGAEACLAAVSVLGVRLPRRHAAVARFKVLFQMCLGATASLGGVFDELYWLVRSGLPDAGRAFPATYRA